MINYSKVMYWYLGKVNLLPFFFSSSVADKSHVHTRIAQSMHGFQDNLSGFNPFEHKSKINSNSETFTAN